MNFDDYHNPLPKRSLEVSEFLGLRFGLYSRDLGLGCCSKLMMSLRGPARKLLRLLSGTNETILDVS